MIGSPQAATNEELVLQGDDAADRWFGADSGSMSVAGRRVSPDKAMQISAVYACISLLAKTAASIPLTMRRIDPKTGIKVDAPEHPLNELLEHQPNKWQTAWDFKAYLMANVALRGNGYAEILPGPRGFADRLEPLHPDIVTPERLPDWSIRYRVQDPVKGLRYVLQDEMFHIRSHVAPGGVLGISPVTYAKETVGLTLAAEEHGGRVFSNGARPSGVVTVEKTMSDKAFDRFKAEWRAGFNGLGNSGRTPILEEGAKFQAISLSADETQFLQTREFQIEEIARWFDIPLVLLHHMTKTSSWGTGVEAIMLAFVRNNLRPWLACWTGAIRRDLILAPNFYEAYWDVDDLQRGDSKAQSEFFSKLVLNGILTRNEARAALGYNPIPGLDEPLVPTNTTTPDNMPTNDAPKDGSAAMIGHNGGPAIDEPVSEQIDA
jgi:HK97 family phage portal protein